MDDDVEEPEDVDDPLEPPDAEPAGDGAEGVEPELSPEADGDDDEVVVDDVVDFPEPRESVR